jgi:uncharacterized protein (DUF433 family)
VTTSCDCVPREVPAFVASPGR